MHYRWYKVAIQECQSIIAMLENEQLNSVTRLWIKGILADLHHKISEDEMQDSIAKAQLLKCLNKILGFLDTVSSSYLIGYVEQLLITIKRDIPVKIRIDLLFARPVSAVYCLLVYEQLKKYDFVELRIVATDYYPMDIYHSSGQHAQLVEYLKSSCIDYIPYYEYEVFHILPDMLFFSYHNHVFTKPLHLQQSTLTSIINRTMFLEYTFNPDDLIRYNSQYTITPYTWLQFRTSEFSRNSISWGQQDIVTGHPLIDLSYGIYSGDSTVAIPEEWAKPDESRTVILWNINPKTNDDTSINRAETRKKISKVLQVISDLCDRYCSIIIILRPHPLCYLPEFQPFFAELNARVFLDQNPDSYPALSFADAYIGDYSSLYRQYLPSQRPALIFDAQEDELNIAFWSQTNLASGLEEAYPFVEALICNYSAMMRPVTETDKYYLGPMDGKSSERISSAMINKFIEEEAPFIHQYCPLLVNGTIDKEPML
ncbi:CDP-glycerol glycerophosphotransferase family protein [Paenibacillus paeoniae]|uniref:CDP-glycerol--glycerophosphate glycerophosphotransferase n=1 Tax=Paenibacillus paeoniae TaxID=2292705 RepID=A0A371P0V4_9BACL|nr:CDP-glycerol glycerophosphotransferase family protein [Paenibacillus paeoniae]REK69573.1 hypothetical protein DX130_24030 [Paenibacillus paeoniae]